MAHLDAGRFAFVTVLLSAAVACSASVDATGETGTSGSAELMTRQDAVGRAEQWVAVQLPYCQSANHARDYDPSCSAYCTRTDNAAWDPYRSDCSGLVSWAWNLPAPGRVTTQFAPFQNDISHAINADDLQPGDAVNSTDHVMLFKEWIVPGKNARFIEEPGCSASTPYAHELVSSVWTSGSSIGVSYNGMTFTAIRYSQIADGAPAADGVAHPYVVVASKSGHGYWEARPDGAVFSFGDAAYHGGANTFVHPAPIVGMARSSSGGGYWQVAQDGAVYSFGDAQYHGGLNTIPHATPVIGIASTGGGGYWIVTRDGAVYSFGDAQYEGGANASPHAPMLAVAPTPSGHGYWMLASDGAIYSFGDAQYHGGLNTIPHPAAPIAIAVTQGSGYWIAAADGAVYSFGDAAYRGGANTVPHSGAIVAIAASSGSGYWLTAADGAMYSFGDAQYHGGANAK